MSVRSWQDTLRLKTYPLGPDDPNPPFQRQGHSWAIYPYPMRDDLLEGPPEERDWTALHLENEYLHCIVLPELGGHLYSLFDKVCHREVFYRNHVVKYGLVSVRGAWVSGGIEFNFPTGHTYTTVDPVSWEIGQNEEEEEAWLVVGNICRLSRMEWWVRLSLGQDERRLREEVFLHNRMPYKQRHWFWNNSAVPAREDLRLVYPARKARVAGGIVDYPIMADGTDISWYRNHDHADDIFTLGVREGFFGCHYVDSDFGMVNISDPRDVKGRKFFTWGTADDGMIWVDLLTDDDGQYVEIQSGRFETQSIWEFIQPGETVSWEEWWLPEHGMGGWVWANEDAVLNFELASNQIRFGALSTWRMEGAVLSLEADGETIWSQEMLLRPDRPYRGSVPMPPGCNEGTEFALVLSLPGFGGEVIRYVHPPEYTRHPKVAETGEDVTVPPKAEDDCVPEELCVRAEEALRQLNTPEARRLFAKALDMDEGFSRARVGLGLLDYQSALYESAREHLTRAIERDRSNGEAWYYLGLVRHQMGDLDGAADALQEASRLPGWREAALEALLDVGADRLHAQVARHDGDDEHADELPMPIRIGLYGLRGIERDLEPDGVEDALIRFTQWARGDVQMWLEMTHGCSPGTAVQILELARRECAAAAAYPMTHYLLAWWYEALGRQEDAEVARQRARECAPDFCFPNRPEELSALQFAVAHDPADWKARYYLGNVLAALGRHAEAMEQWRAAAELDDTFAVLQRNLAYGVLHWESDPAEAARRYHLAIERNPGDYRYYLALADIYAKHWDLVGRTILSAPGIFPSPEPPSSEGEGEKAERSSVTGSEAAVAVVPSAEGRGAEGEAFAPRREIAAQLALFRSAPADIQSKWQIAARVADLLSQLGRYDEALSVLSAHRFFPWEGARGMRSIYVDCLLARGQAAAERGDHAAALADFEAATQYPRNLGVGKVARPQDARIWWLAAQEAGLLGDASKKEAYLSEAADEPHGGPCEVDWWKLLALRELGRTEEAGELASRLQGWAQGLLGSERTRAQGEEMLRRLGA